MLSRLETMLGEPRKATIYPCIRDLVEHGIDLARFSAGEIKPQRQDVTQYVAAWSRHAGLGEEETRDWLIDYCSAAPDRLIGISMLSMYDIDGAVKECQLFRISNTTPSLIAPESRHSRQSPTHSSNPPEHRIHLVGGEVLLRRKHVSIRVDRHR